MMRLSGLKAHLFQLYSALVLAIALPILLGYFYFASPPQNYPELITLLRSPLLLTLFALTAGTLLFHLWVGVRDVFIDYLPKRRLTTALIVWATLLLAMAANLLTLLFWTLAQGAQP
jgi:succinate dehydrogenase / fumarate reductase membrane anchor subunit